MYHEEMIYLEEQLSLIRSLQELRGPVFDTLLRMLNVLDTYIFYTALISFIWIGLSWRWGVRLGLLLVVNGIVNSVAKIAFEMPRPFYYDPSLAIVEVQGYGFPSGGAQMAMLFGVLLIAYWKNRWAWPIAIFYVLLVSFSRVALGAHFVLDILGGWALGLIVAVLFISALKPVEAFASKNPYTALVLFSLPAIFAAVLLPVKLKFLTAIGVVCAAGVYLSTKYGFYLSYERPWWKKIIHGFIGMAGAGILGYISKDILPNKYLIEGIMGALWVSLIASPLCKRI